MTEIINGGVGVIPATQDAPVTNQHPFPAELGPAELVMGLPPA